MNAVFASFRRPVRHPVHLPPHPYPPAPSISEPELFALLTPWAGIHGIIIEDREHKLQNDEL